MAYDEYEYELPGRLTIARSAHRAALDDIMCSVFCDPSVVADIMGFDYLSKAPNGYPSNVHGIFYGHNHRIMVPMVVESWSGESSAPLRRKIAMMYDTGGDQGGVGGVGGAWLQPRPRA